MEIYNNWSPYLYGANNPIRYEDTNGEGPGDRVLGFVVAFVDNALGGVTPLREMGARYVSDGGGADYNYGQNVGDGFSVAVGAGMVDGGSTTAAGGVAVTVGTGGLAGEVGVPAALIGTAVAAEGAVLGTAGALNLSSQKGRVNVEGKQFNGKSDTNSGTSREAYRKAKDQNGVPRSQQPDKVTTVREKGIGKPLKQTEYTNSQGQRVQIRKDNPKTYPDGGTQGKHYNAGEAGEKLKQHHNYEN